MAKDYKYRVQTQYGKNEGSSPNLLLSVNFWKWMLITASIISIVVFVVYWQVKSLNQTNSFPVVQEKSEKNPDLSKQDSINKLKKTTELEKQNKNKQPRFDFYTILPEKEVVVPDYEVTTRTREERVGKQKESNYMLQAGSYKTLKEADIAKGRIGLLGIEAKVHKAKVGNAVWYRVKVGPYSHISSVNTIKSRLRQNGVDVIVTETSQ